MEGSSRKKEGAGKNDSFADVRTKRLPSEACRKKD